VLLQLCEGALEDLLPAALVGEPRLDPAQGLRDRWVLLLESLEAVIDRIEVRAHLLSQLAEPEIHLAEPTPSGVLGDGWLESILTPRTGVDCARRMGTTAETLCAGDTRAAITRVKGTLVCDTKGSAGVGNSTLVDTPLVPLSAQGDAEFRGSVGPLSGACVIEADIAFVVRIGAGRWIANGAVRRP